MNDKVIIQIWRSTRFLVGFLWNCASEPYFFYITETVAWTPSVIFFVQA